MHKYVSVENIICFSEITENRVWQSSSLVYLMWYELYKSAE